MTVKELIQQSGFKQNYIADCMGISETSLCHKMKGRRAFSETEIERLATTLEMPLRIVRRAAEWAREQYLATRG